MVCVLLSPWLLLMSTIISYWGIITVTLSQQLTCVITTHAQGIKVEALLSRESVVLSRLWKEVCNWDKGPPTYESAFKYLQCCRGCGLCECASVWLWPKEDLSGWTRESKWKRVRLGVRVVERTRSAAEKDMFSVTKTSVGMSRIAQHVHRGCQWSSEYQKEWQCSRKVAGTQKTVAS